MERRHLLLSATVLVVVLLGACTAAAAAAEKAAAVPSSCDAYRGSWVVDESYPLYDAASCPFVRTEFDCRRNGRPDTAYLKYRWQPSPPCSLPRFVSSSSPASRADRHDGPSVAARVAFELRILLLLRFVGSTGGSC